MLLVGGVAENVPEILRTLELLGIRLQEASPSIGVTESIEEGGELHESVNGGVEGDSEYPALPAASSSPHVQ